MTFPYGYNNFSSVSNSSVLEFSIFEFSTFFPNIILTVTYNYYHDLFLCTTRISLQFPFLSKPQHKQRNIINHYCVHNKYAFSVNDEEWICTVPDNIIERSNFNCQKCSDILSSSIETANQHNELYCGYWAFYTDAQCDTIITCQPSGLFAYHQPKLPP